jgi:hypothetical protein
MTALRRTLSACAVLAVTAAAPSRAAPNLITNGNFKAGNTGFTTGYELTTMTPYLFQDGVHGIYTVEKAGRIAGSSAYGDWTNISTAPSGKNANVYVADASTSAGTVVWSQTVTVTPNTRYKFIFYAAEVSDACCSNAQMAASVNGTTLGTLTASASWQKAGYVWRSGSATTATLTLIDTNTSGPYNDFALDDLSFKALK